MVIYQNRSSGQIEANYFDSSKHVIHCKLAATDKTDFAQFVSDAPSGPVFRLSFMLGTSTRLTLTFEVKPPGTEAGFQTVTFRSKEWYRNRLVFFLQQASQTMISQTLQAIPFNPNHPPWNHLPF